MLSAKFKSRSVLPEYSSTGVELCHTWVERIQLCTYMAWDVYIHHDFVVGRPSAVLDNTNGNSNITVVTTRSYRVTARFEYTFW
eukprot:SAG31_NODE_939_length_10873_cov_5.403843_5_plen_84_part_00